MAILDKLEKVTITVDGVKRNVVGGSYKGVPFFVDEYVSDGNGRNIVTRTVPFSNDFVNEDVGGKVPTYGMTVYFVGDECLQARDNLVAACNEEGSGELVHPFYGLFDARCVSLTVRGDRKALNYCTAEITLVPASRAEGIATRRDLAGVTRATAETFRERSVGKFATVFSIVGKGKAAVDAAATATEKALDVVLKARTLLSTANGFLDAIGKIKANSEAMMMAPEDFANRLCNIVTASAEMFGVETTDDDLTLDEYVRMAGELVTGDSSDTPSGQIRSLMCKLSISQMAVALVDAEFDSVDNASEYQQTVSAIFERALSVTDDIDEYLAMSELETTALSYLRDIMADIAVVVDKDIADSCDILSLCYDVYGSLDRVDDIMARNGLAQGLFIRPGKVKVLSK